MSLHNFEDAVGVMWHATAAMSQVEELSSRDTTGATGSAGYECTDCLTALAHTAGSTKRHTTHTLHFCPLRCQANTSHAADQTLPLCSFRVPSCLSAASKAGLIHSGESDRCGGVAPGAVIDASRLCGCFAAVPAHRKSKNAREGALSTHFMATDVKSP